MILITKGFRNEIIKFCTTTFWSSFERFCRGSSHFGGMTLQNSREQETE